MCPALSQRDFTLHHTCRDSGEHERCTELYKELVTKYAPHDPRLKKALQDAEGKSTGREAGSQGWILFSAMNVVLTAPVAPSRSEICEDIRKAIVMGSPLW